MDERLRSLPPAELDNIMEIARRIAEAVHPLRIYLFGSFADGTWGDDSDYDFYIVVEDGKDTREESMNVRRGIWGVSIRPVDIIFGPKSRFDKYGPRENTFYIESEVFRKGIVLYDTDTEERIAG